MLASLFLFYSATYLSAEWGSKEQLKIQFKRDIPTNPINMLSKFYKQQNKNIMNLWVCKCECNKLHSFSTCIMWGNQKCLIATCSIVHRSGFSCSGSEYKMCCHSGRCVGLVITSRWTSQGLAATILPASCTNRNVCLRLKAQFTLYS